MGMEDMSISIGPDIRKKLERMAKRKNRNLPYLIKDILTQAALIDSEDAWFYSKYWQKKLRDAEKNISEGKASPPFDNADEAIVWLRS